MQDSVQASPAPSLSFHAHHAPLGAFATFTLGFVGKPGGFGHALRAAAHQNVYIGFRRGSGPFRLLPFFLPPQSAEGSFTGEAASVSLPNNVEVLNASDFDRKLGWASDTWLADQARFVFSLLSPFATTDEPSSLSKSEARLAFSPHINGSIEYDNSDGTEPVELIFGLGDPDHVFHPLEDMDAKLNGFALGTQFAYATSAKAEARQGFDVFEPKFRDYHGLCLIGGESALVFKVEPGKKRAFPLVFAFFQDGVATTGIKTHYAYTRWFDDICDVVHHGLEQRKHYEKQAKRRDAELDASSLSDDQRFLLAHATHSYFGNSQLLWGKAGPIWVVNEGEYRMMNTFDLTVDHLFFELRWFPWAVKNTLDLFVEHYSYTDKIKVGTELKRGGIAFTHDMGVQNSFTPKQRSSYECDNLTGCFSHMTTEQLLNWVLCAVTYALRTADLRWLKKQRQILTDCAESMRRRDNPDASLRNGIPKHDSARCGTGAEITTYDSLDVSLGQARNNLYLSVKTLGAWLLLEAAYAELSLEEESAAAALEVERLAGTLATHFDTASNTFPAVFEHGNTSRIIPAVEGLVYPLFLQLNDALTRDSKLHALLALLETHISSVMVPGVCIDESSGGWKMSSTSTNTWFSKIAISQHVLRSLFPKTLSPLALAADAVHAAWQRNSSCGAHAMCDQIRSDTGETCGSRYYPRGVTAILWLDE